MRDRHAVGRDFRAHLVERALEDARLLVGMRCAQAILGGERAVAAGALALFSGQVTTNPRPTTIEDMRGILQAMRTPTGG